MEERTLRRAVIKEELVALTGNAIDAVILQQFIYWSERVKDFDKFKEQENRIAKLNGEAIHELSAGWIYKTADQLAEETMLGLSKASMRSHIKNLIDRGYLAERQNPKCKWDRTTQYRVSLYAVQKGLNNLGFTLEGYVFEDEKADNPRKTASLEIKPRSLEIKLQSSDFKLRSDKNFTTIPKTITENTTEITVKENIKKKESFDFDILWKPYPKKRGKSAITKKALKELEQVGYEPVLKAIENYKAEIQRNHTSEQYIMNGSTFFNGRWKDYENESEEVNDNPYANVGTILR